MTPEQAATTYVCKCRDCGGMFLCRCVGAPYCAGCLLPRVVVSPALRAERDGGHSARLPAGAHIVRVTAVPPASSDGGAPSPEVLAAMRAGAHYAQVQRETEAYLTERALVRHRRGNVAGGLVVFGAVLLVLLLAVALSLQTDAWRGI